MGASWIIMVRNRKQYHQFHTDQILLEVTYRIAFYLTVNLKLFRYNCNRYDEDEARLAREGQEKSRHALQRYLFYCNRYMNHLQSLKFENKLYSMVKVNHKDFIYNL